MEDPFNYQTSEEEPGCLEYGLMFVVGFLVNGGLAFMGSAGALSSSNQAHWFVLTIFVAEIGWGAFMMQRRKMGPAVCGLLFSAVICLLIYGACYSVLTASH
ncbi:MAG: hypothetical protein H6510_15480 [Acidobacteria bacterium]|nr:hypothetical protein [Acidobacteriota bacterium]MCB9399215.1 hypothetical protein [Acidobacteriota bacterium]